MYIIRLASNKLFKTECVIFLTQICVISAITANWSVRTADAGCHHWLHLIKSVEFGEKTYQSVDSVTHGKCDANLIPCHNI